MSNHTFDKYHSAGIAGCALVGVLYAAVCFAAWHLGKALLPTIMHILLAMPDTSFGAVAIVLAIIFVAGMGLLIVALAHFAFTVLATEAAAQLARRWGGTQYAAHMRAWQIGQGCTLFGFVLGSADVIYLLLVQWHMIESDVATTSAVALTLGLVAALGLSTYRLVTREKLHSV